MKSRIRKRIAAACIIALIGILAAFVVKRLEIGQSLRRAAYDLPFRFHETEPPPGIVLIGLDESSHARLDQPLAQPWDRRLHADLVRRLTQAGAEAVVFDILFHDERSEEDPEFAAALKEHGLVILAGEIIREGDDGNRLLLPAPALRQAAAGWGLTDVPQDPDGVVRRIRHLVPTDFGDKASLAGALLSRLGRGEVPGDTRLRLIHHYGRAGSFPRHSVADVLLGNVSPDAFRGRIVIIGAMQKAGLMDAGKDLFPTPYLPVPIEEKTADGKTVRYRALTSGLEIQATLLGNLIEGRGVRPVSARGEALVFALTGIALAACACLLPVFRGVSLGLFLTTALAAAGILLQQRQGLHFAWTIPVIVQMPLITALGLGAQYLIEHKSRRRLRRAFKSYLSDEQARLIDEDAVSLEPGGREITATILFSDLAGFTTLSEDLTPAALSKALTTYFENATKGILANQGTIIKFIGDAVLAIWGAPVRMEREADRAIDAAIRMQLDSAAPVSLETPDGMIDAVLETRIGIHTGPGLVGNLGCSARFDYSIVGDAVNTAARLESLNKALGTSVLVSSECLAACIEPGRFLTRPVGCFILKGKTRGITVHELLGRRDELASCFRPRRDDYLEIYQAALDAFTRGDFSAAEAGFTRCLPLHDRLPECPAARLHLEALASLPDQPPADWNGAVALDEK